MLNMVIGQIVRYDGIARSDFNIINFECYRELAKKVSGYQIPPHLEQKRKVKNIVYLRHQLDTVALDENAEDSLLRTLKEEEEIVATYLTLIQYDAFFSYQKTRPTEQ
jgi:hypothetical protein